MTNFVRNISKYILKYGNHCVAGSGRPYLCRFLNRQTSVVQCHSDYICCYSKLGNITSKQYSRSEKRCLKDVLILSGVLTWFGFRKQDESETESELIMTIKRGILLIQKGEYKKSEQMLHLALKLAQDQQNHQAVTYIYDVMANLAFDVGELDKAEKLFLSVMQNVLAAGVPQDDNKIIHMSLKLAKIYQEKKDNRKAEEGFQFCTKHLSKKVDAETTDEDILLLWAMTLDWYARFLLEQDHYKEAFTYFEKAYDMSVRINGNTHEQTVVLLNDLGTICCLQADYDGAIKYLKQAVSIGEDLPEMEDFASIYVNLGTVYLKKNMLEEAKKACQDGWKNAKMHNNKETLGEANICLDALEIKKRIQQRN